jgi:hypothetical protein
VLKVASETGIGLEMEDRLAPTAFPIGGQPSEPANLGHGGHDISHRPSQAASLLHPASFVRGDCLLHPFDQRLLLTCGSGIGLPADLGGYLRWEGSLRTTPGG